MKELFLYSRDGCHLCEDMHSDIRKIISGKDVSCHIINITGDPELEQRYGARIPVLVTQTEELCELYLDRSRLNRFLAHSA